MIHQIMIVSKGGLCLYHYNFSIMEINPQLVAGFTTAIDSFSQSLIAERQSIESLQMSALYLRITPFSQGNLTMIVFFNKYDNLEIIDLLIFDLQTQFLERFGYMNFHQSNDLNVFRKFDKIVETLSVININIGFISHQSDYKTDIWKKFSNAQIKESGNDPVNSRGLKEIGLNAIQIKDPLLKSCILSIWNYNIESLEKNVKLLQDNHLFLVIIEPNFEFLQNLVSKIAFLREKFPKAQISGLIVSEKGAITQKNCELILQIPTFEIFLDNTSLHEDLIKILRDITLGM